MKKIIFILFLFVSCYYIYEATYNSKLHYVSLGDGISKGMNSYGMVSYGYSDYIKTHLISKDRLSSYNKSFAKADIRIIDIINMIEDNAVTNTSDGELSINQLLGRADIISLSVGMSELSYKLNINTDNIYEYIDNMIGEADILFKYIDKYDSKYVFVIGYYNIYNGKDDIFDYANIKLKKLCNKYKFSFISVSKLPSEYVIDRTRNNYYPSTEGYRFIANKITERLDF